MKGIKITIILLCLAGFSPDVFARTSTVNGLIPATGSPLSSASIRNNFAATASDINTIYGLIATAGSNPGGTNGQIQFNNDGSFGGLTIGTALANSGSSLNVQLGTAAGTAAAGNDSRITGALQGANNLSDLASAATARGNLGLGSMATQDSSGVAITGGALTGVTVTGTLRGDISLATVTTDASLPGTATLYQRFGWVKNVVDDCGLAVNSTADQTTLLQACQDAAVASVPPKPLVFPQGTFYANLQVDGNVSALICEGSTTNCVLKSPAFSNKAALSTKNFSTLYHSYSNNGSNYLYLQNMTIDGNYPNQDSGSSAELYGYSMVFQNTNFINGKDHALIMDGGGTGGILGMESHWRGGYASVSGKDLVVFCGPHDSQWEDLIFIDPSLDDYGQYSTLLIPDGCISDLKIDNFHPWRHSHSPKWAIDDESHGFGKAFTNVLIDAAGSAFASGDHGGIRTTSQGTVITGKVQQYGGSTDNNTYAVQIANNSAFVDVKVACSPGTAPDGPVGIGIGAADWTYSTGNVIKGSVGGSCTGGPVDFTYSGGNNTINLLAGSATVRGSPASGDDVHIVDGNRVLIQVPNTIRNISGDVYVGPYIGPSASTLLTTSGTGNIAMYFDAAATTKFVYDYRGYFLWNSSGFAQEYDSGDKFPGVNGGADTASQSGMGIRNTATDVSAPYLAFGKSPGGAVSNGMGTGLILFEGSDGTHMRQAASIQGLAQGTATTGATPGKLLFNTTNTDGSATLALSIDNAQNVAITGSLGLATATPRSSADFGYKTDALVLQTGTTGQRPSSPVAGMLRDNTTLAGLEAYVNGAWASLLTSTNTITLGTAANSASPSRSGEVGTGLYSDTASTVEIATGAIERLRVTATGSVGVGTATPKSSVDFSGKTDALVLQSGTTGQRPTGLAGMVRYNSTVGAVEAYGGSAAAWNALKPGLSVPGYASGDWYPLLQGSNNTATSLVATKARAFAEPMCIGASGVTITDIGYRVTTAGVGSTSIAGIYDNTGTGGRPGNLIVAQNTPVNTTSSSTDVDFSISATFFSPGCYWVAFAHNWSTTAPTVNTWGSISPYKIVGGASINDATGGAQNAGVVYVDFTYANGMPNPFGTSTDFNASTGGPALGAFKAQ